MKVPSHLRERLQAHLWKKADMIDWVQLSPIEKSNYYDQWVRDDKIGGLLKHFMDPPDIRRYLHSLMAGYASSKLEDPERPLRVLRVSNNAEIEQEFSNPLGCLLRDGRLIAWGRANTWKSLLLALHERAYTHETAAPYGVVLFDATGRYKQRVVRRMIEDAARKLGVENIKWLEM